MEQSTKEILALIQFAVPITLVIFKISKYKVDNEYKFKSDIIGDKFFSKDKNPSFILFLAAIIVIPSMILVYILEYIFKMLTDIGWKLMLILLVSFYGILFLIKIFSVLLFGILSSGLNFL